MAPNDLPDVQTPPASLPDGRHHSDARQALLCRRLQLQRFRGIRERAQELIIPADSTTTFAPGINIVFGANASGKTTAALALQALIWPEAAPAPQDAIRAEFEFNATSWSVDIDGGRVACQQNGRRMTPPISLRAATAALRDCYRLSLHELLQADDGALALRIQNEINGGIDLHRAAGELELNLKAPAGNRNECQRLRAACEQVNQLRRQHGDLRRRQLTLQQLQSEVDAARAAGSEVVLLEKLLTLRQAEHAAAAAAAAVAAFPAVLVNLNGSECEQVQRLRADIAAQQQALLKAEQQRRHAQAQKAATALERAPRADELETMLRVVEQLQRHSSEHVRLQRAIAAAADAAATARARVGADCTVAQLQALQQHGIEDLAEFIRELETAHAERGALQRLRDYGSSAAEAAPPPVQQLRQGVDLLAQWLGNVPTAPLPSHRLAVVTALGVIVALLTVLAVTQHALWFAALVLPAVLALWLWRTPANSAACAHIAQAYTPKTGLPAPQAWSASAVQARLYELVEELAAAALAAEKTTYVRARQHDLEGLDARFAELENRRCRLAAALGVPTASEAARLYLIIANLCAWQQADLELGKTTAEAAALAQCICRNLQQFNAAIQAFAPARPATDYAEAAGLLQDLQLRAQAFTQAAEKANSAAEMIAVLTAEINTAEDRRRQILLKLQPELPLTDAQLSALEKELHKLDAQLPAFNAAVNNAAGAERERVVAEKQLRGDACFQPQLLCSTTAEVMQLLAAARQKAAAHESLLEQLKSLQAEIAQARQGHDLEAALCEKNNAERSLDDLRCRVEQSVVAATVLEHVRRRNQASASQVLNAARQLFATITRHSFELRVDTDADASFLAYDTRAQRLRTLSQLSSGTRVQLLLAVRLAFIEQQEDGGARLPLVLDELLGNSDDVRAGAIIDAVAAIAARGRQVFYFTAQRDELHKWQQRCGPDVTLAIHSLPISGNAAALPELASIETTYCSAALAPAIGISYAEYGQALTVPALDPYLSTLSHLHMWYLLDDVEQLYRFFRAGYSYWGQVEALAGSCAEAAATALVQLGITTDASVYDQLRVNASVLAEAMRLWQVGRERRLNAAVLRAPESPVSTSKLIDQLVDCANACDGNAAAFLQALDNRQVKGLRSELRERLAEYLQARQCLSSQPRLDISLVQARVDALAATAVGAGLIAPQRVQELVRRVFRHGAADA